jgi:hypothetical protein
MNKSWNVTRRHFLRGLGAAIALPSLDAMASATSTLPSGLALPKRMAFFFVPNGINMEQWRPNRAGAHYDLSPILKPLEPFKRDMNVLSGLTHDKSRANDDGGGDHARSGGVFLTGSQPLKSEGADVRVGMSVDQYAAEVLGADTRFRSLELGTETGRPYGKCDSGYSCGYSSNVSWKNEFTPVTKLVNPREVFERLFANELTDEKAKGRSVRSRYRKSILDFVLEDARALERKVGQDDQQKLDEYLTSVREIEKRIEMAERAESGTAKLVEEYQFPEATMDSAREHLRLLGDMLVLAFQTDVTRVSTIMFANAGSNRAYREIGVQEGHHSLSHHQSRPEKLAKIAEINRFHVEQFAYILQRLKATREGDSNLLDQSMIVYGSALSDGNRHNHEDLPIVLAGRGGGAIETGRHLQYATDTPMCNLFNSMLDVAEVPVGLFGDSTGRLRHLLA